MSIVYVLWLRQLKRFVRSRARIVGALGQPVLFLLALGFGLGPIFERAGQGSYIQFLAPGVIAMTVLFTSIFSGIELIWDRQFGFLKETLVAPVPRLTIMIGRTLGGATVAVIQGIVVFAVCALAGFRISGVAALPEALGFTALIALLFTALGGWGSSPPSIRWPTASTACAVPSSSWPTSAPPPTSRCSPPCRRSSWRWAATCFRAFSSERRQAKVFPAGRAGMSQALAPQARDVIPYDNEAAEEGFIRADHPHRPRAGPVACPRGAAQPQDQERAGA